MSKNLRTELADLKRKVKKLQAAAHSRAVPNNREAGSTADLRRVNARLKKKAEDRLAQENRLRRSEERLRAFTNALPDPGFVFDEEGRCVEVLTSQSSLLHEQAERSRGRLLREIFPKEEADLFHATIRRTLETGALQTLEYSLQVPEGLRWFEARSFPMAQDDHEHGMVVWIARDITKRKRAEELLQQNNRMLRTLRQAQAEFITDSPPGELFDTLLTDLLKLTDSEYGFIGEIHYSSDEEPYLKTRAITNIAWNEETRDFYEKNTPTGMEFHNLRTLFGAVMTTREPVIANTPLTDPRRGGLPEGHPALNSFLGIPLTHGQKLIGMVGIANRPGGYRPELVEFLQPFLATCGVIIEAHRSEQCRMRSEEALRQSEERFRQMAENIHEVFWMTDPENGELQYLSPAYEEIWGRSVDSLEKAGHSWMEGIHLEDRSRVEAAYGRQLQGQRTVEEYRVVRPDQSIRWIRERAFPILDEPGNLSRITGIAEDITQRIEMETHLRQAHKMEAIGTLAGGIAHEFNNILTIVIGYARLALQKTSSDTSRSEDLQNILSAGQRARDLVAQILTFSRKNHMQLGPVDIPRQVMEALSLIRATLPTSIEIRQRIERGEGTVHANPTQLHQILLNLCANAEHAMRDSGGTLTVEVETGQAEDDLAQICPGVGSGPYIVITIRDTGQGMSRDVLERIYEPFFTTKGVGAGTGMGLPIVHGIVMSYGGAMKVESNPGEGTTVKIYLPQMTRATDEDPPHADEGLVQGRGRILLVDDEPAVARLGKATLERRGFEVTIETSSTEALEAFRAQPGLFDLVVTDQTMPTMTGEHLARQLRMIRPDIPIVLCTGYSHAIDESRSELLGIDAFCMKPCEVDDLAKLIQRVLAKRGERAS